MPLHMFAVSLSSKTMKKSHRSKTLGTAVWHCLQYRILMVYGRGQRETNTMLKVSFFAR